METAEDRLLSTDVGYDFTNPLPLTGMETLNVTNIESPKKIFTNPLPLTGMETSHRRMRLGKEIGTLQILFP